MCHILRKLFAILAKMCTIIAKIFRQKLYFAKTKFHESLPSEYTRNYIKYRYCSEIQFVRNSPILEYNTKG